MHKFEGSSSNLGSYTKIDYTKITIDNIDGKKNPS